MSIKNSVVIVTGASSGIGAAVARMLTDKGARVVLAARSKQKLLSLSRDLPGSFVVVTDMTKPAEIRRLVRKTMDHFGRIDILVNNAGQGYDAPVEYIDIATFHAIFDLDVVGPLIAMQEVIPIMRKMKHGSIVNISSATALMALPNMAAYASLKKAVAHISLTARAELSRDGIQVTVVYPYMTATDFEQHTLKDHVQDDPGVGGGPPQPPDSADYVAEKIVAGIQSGEAEIFAHDWLKKFATVSVVG